MSKKAFTDFPLDEIAKIARNAGNEARQESLESGLDVLSKDVETGEFYIESLNEKGEVVKRVLSEEEVEFNCRTLNGGRNPEC